MIKIIYMGTAQPGATLEVASHPLPMDADLYKIIISTTTGLAAPIKLKIGMGNARDGIVADMDAIDWIVSDIYGAHKIQLYGPCDLYIDRIIGDSNRSLYIYCDNQSAAPASILATYAVPDQCYG